MDAFDHRYLYNNRGFVSVFKDLRALLVENVLYRSWTFIIQASIVFAVVAFFGRYHFHIGWFENDTRDHIAFATAYILFLAILFTALVAFNAGWDWKITAVLFTLLLDWMLMRFDILHLSKKWSLGHFFILRCSVLIVLGMFNQLFLSSDWKRNTVTEQ